MRVALIDYGSGNLRSAEKALDRAGEALSQNVEVLVTAAPEVVAGADRVVLPGVGAFADCKAGLAALPGMLEALEQVARIKARPFLGICVGMQLLAEQGLEFGSTPGLAWIAGQVARIQPDDPALKIPHMGWNSLDFRGERHPVLANLEAEFDAGPHAGNDAGPDAGSRALNAAGGPFVYFVHSFAMTPSQTTSIQATTPYGGDIVAAVAVDNIFGTQFHPEKSQAVGLRLLQNFLRWKP